MRYWILVVCLMLMSAVSVAQENDLTPYEIALQRIAEAEATGATELDLSNLGLSEVPPEIGNLINLRALFLYENQLRYLPSEIGNLTQLNILSIRDNQLEYLPNEFSQLNVCWLEMQNNTFQTIPVHLHNLSCSDSVTGYPSIFHIDDYLLDDLPDEVVAGGTEAILDYLENRAEWHLRQMIISVLAGVGVLVLTILGLRWRYTQQRRKPKKKRSEG